MYVYNSSRSNIGVIIAIGVRVAAKSIKSQV